MTKFCAAFLPVVALATAVFAAEQPTLFRGQTVWTDGAEIRYVEDSSAPDSELLLIYKNAEPGAVNTFRTSAAVEARVLAVGGGGAGGGGTTTTTNPGGGGGGGQVVERNNERLAAGTYTITVGAGGGQTTTQRNGEDGLPSILTFGGVEVVKALGGGGGGARDNGNGGDNVATGGGGSGKDSIGGVGALGNAYAGGAANGTYCAGGGAGAGGAGGDADSTKGGDGGEGAFSDIGLDCDLSRRYGGGGGGARSNGTNPSQAGEGSDGGGHGGYTNAPGEDGTPGTGGGGGGGGKGSAGKTGGAGGSGIVIIRLTAIEQPMTWMPIDVSAGGHTGKVFIDSRAVYQWVGGDLVITYTDTSVRGGLRFFDPEQPDLPPVLAKARVLAVGGGGGGGMIDMRNGGGGAGGGAGGFVEQSGLVFDGSAEYSIAVGKGGKGGATRAESGRDGGNSSITVGGVDVCTVAIGGGGGGAQSRGRDGGSGGGGSRLASYEQGEGGSCVNGQGCVGGLGYGMYCGAGGGGAGGRGEDVTSGPEGGRGGAAMASDITGATRLYAAGGGGASVNRADQTSLKYLGGFGGSCFGECWLGGNGAGVDGGETGRAFNPIPATSGVDGTGSGGGGGVSYEGAYETAGDGGDGVVVIRLSGFVVGTVPVPTAASFVYDGEAHRGVAEHFAYELTGTTVATDAGVYTTTATIKPGFPLEWGDAIGGQGPRVITWRINQKRVPMPEIAASFVYTGEEACPVDRDKLRLDEEGYCWTNEGLRYCRLFGYQQTDAGDYVLTAKLVQENFVTNFVWESTGSMADATYAWRITTAPNRVEKFSYDGYRTDRIIAHHPTNLFSAVWGKDTAQCYFCTADEDGNKIGDWQNWGNGPQTKGNYRVKVVIPEPSSRNWASVEAELPFGVWEALDDIFSDHVTITFPGYSGGALNDFPVPVRLREPTNEGLEPRTGFSYQRAGATGLDIRFFDQDGDPVPHEVDTWDVDGESIVWVKMPALRSGVRLTMCWKRVEGIRVPEYNPTAVWRDNYAGVWHLSSAKGGRYVDSTGNGLDAYLTDGADAESIDGRVGKGLYLKGGELRAADYEPYLTEPGGPFSFSGWYLGKDYMAGGTKGTPARNLYMFAGKKTDGQAANPEQFASGWCLAINNSVTYYTPYASGNTTLGNRSIPNISTTWSHLGIKAPVIGATTSLYSYYNGTEAGSSGRQVLTNSLPLQIVRQGFAADEVRLARSSAARMTAWMRAEYISMNSPTFSTFGCVVREGKTCDYWKALPGLSKMSWKEGQPSAGVNRGVYAGAGGSVSAISVTFLKLPEETPLDPNEMPTVEGNYRVVFDHAELSQYEPCSIGINFTISAPIYDLLIASTENGVVETSITNSILAGTEVSVLARPNANYEVGYISVDNVVVQGASFIMPSRPVTVSAMFRKVASPVAPGEFEPECYIDSESASSAVVRINDNKAGFIAAPEGVTTTPDYLKLFAARSVYKSGKYVVEIGLTPEAETMLREQVSDSVESKAADLVDVSRTSATVTTIPGLYYMILGGTEVGDISTSGTKTLATGGTTVLPKPNLGVTTKAFYRISVSEK